MTIPESKTCSKCGEEKPLEKFVRGRRTCSACRAAYYAEWRRKNPGKKEAIDKAWHDANRDHVRQRKAAYRARNKEHIAEYLREWHKANPRAKIEYKARRRARRAEVEVQRYTRTEIFERDGGRCRGCNKTLEDKPRGFEIDHIVPISLGGPDIPANVQLMCRSCNRQKATRLEGQIHLAV